MPRHDPVPPKRPAARPHPGAPPQGGREDGPLAWARYKQMMKWMALAALVAVLLSLIWLKSFGEPVPIHMTIATILGVGLTVLVGAGLMGLIFLSSRTGVDDEAGRSGEEEEHQE